MTLPEILQRTLLGPVFCSWFSREELEGIDTWRAGTLYLLPFLVLPVGVYLAFSLVFRLPLLTLDLFAVGLLFGAFILIAISYAPAMAAALRIFPLRALSFRTLFVACALVWAHLQILSLLYLMLKLNLPHKYGSLSLLLDTGWLLYVSLAIFRLIGKNELLSRSRRIVGTAMCIGASFFAGSIFGTISFLALRNYVVQARFIASDSNLPALQEGERLLATLSSARSSGPRRGEFWLFYPPGSQPGFYETILSSYGMHDDGAVIKRVVGLPGDRIEIVAEEGLRINGEQVHDWEIQHRPNESFAAEVPEGCYFVLGDNINLSRDSRRYGSIASENLIGRAEIVYFPFDRVRSLL